MAQDGAHNTFNEDSHHLQWQSNNGEIDWQKLLTQNMLICISCELLVMEMLQLH
jgi:hypothetical protein